MNPENPQIHKRLSTLMTLLLMCSMVLLSREAAEYANAQTAGKGKHAVVIDSGHGGVDPGKIAGDGTLEKDINLSIAQKLAQYLEAADVQVLMTRTDDEGLYSPHASNKKLQDMQNRIALMEEHPADLVVSIHQNSYSDPSVKGAQVFYYEGSTNSRALAETLQDILVEKIDPENHRKAKANSTYYLLKKTTRPIVIVECGFLSNPTEAALLKTDSYQDALAWALHLGVLEHLNK